MPQALISGNIMFFYGFFVVLVSVFCVETTTHTDALTPLNTSQNEEMMAPSSLMTYQATASLEKVNISRLLMSITPASARGRQIPLNFYRTTELQETMNEHSFKRRQPAMVRSATSPKPIIKQRVAAATAEKEATSKSTTVSTSRNFRKINLAESSGAVSTSLSTTPLSANGESSATPIANGESSKFFSNVQAAINQLMSTSGREVVRKLQQANISTDCSLGLLQFTRAIQDLQPWAMRLIDATGKYPTGSLQGTFADLGAYDECIETVVRDEYGTLKVRGQYCDVHLSILDQEILDQIVFPAILNYNKRMGRFMSFLTDKSLPGIRLGVCFIDACKEQDLANIGSIVAGSFMKITVKDCVTNEYEEINVVQAWIIAFLAVLSAVITCGTIFELFTGNWENERKNALYYKCITAFSVVSNSQRILKVTENGDPDTQDYRFVHGLRCLSIFWICLGHSYSQTNENRTRIFNAVNIFESWESPIMSAGFIAVDTFFFISGYVLYLNLNKQKRSRVIVAVVAILRRFLRFTIPTFFMIMCIYLLPLIASGPYSKEFYDRFDAEVRQQWWHLIGQFYNWRMENYEVRIMTHLWYLSADFQLFIVAVAVIQTFRTKNWVTVFIFVVLSLLCCGIGAWHIYGTNLLPFVATLHKTYRAIIDTTTQYYTLPFYHAVCFFSGCITFNFVQQYGKTKISKSIQAFLWCIALCCGLCCLYMKLDWNLNGGQASETKRMFAAFFDRVLWSVCISWFSFACTTGRGGFVNQFLSWNGFVPLARLSFGVYLVHLPFYHLMYRIGRERSFYSHFTLVSNCFVVLVWSHILSFILCVTCELPTMHLEKMVFMRWIKKQGAMQEPKEEHHFVGERA
nr:nose resistant to fluoxetine protein 6-like [Rhipicephalus microplus]